MISKIYWALIALLLGLSTTAFGQGGNGRGNGPGGLNGAVATLETGLFALTQEVADQDGEIAAIQSELQTLFTLIDGLGGGILVDTVDCVVGDELQTAIDSAPYAGAILTVSGTCNYVEIRGKTNIHLIGDGTAQIQGSIFGIPLSIVSSANIQVNQIDMVGGSGANAALSISSSSVKLDNVDLSGGSRETMLVSSGSTVELTGNVLIDTQGAFAGIRASNQSSVYSGGDLFITAPTPDNDQSGLYIRENSSFTQFGGSVDIRGLVTAENGSQVKISNGNLQGISRPVFEDYLLLRPLWNSRIVLNALNSSDTITAEGGFLVYANSHLDIEAGSGTLNHTSNGITFIQQNSSLQIAGLNVNTEIDTIYLRRNAVLHIFGANPVIGEANVETGSGIAAFGGPGYPGLLAICAIDQAVWTNNQASCAP